MKKRILAVVATAIMVVSSTVMAFADTTTNLIGQYNFDQDLKNEVTGSAATLTAGKVNVELAGTEEAIFSNGMTDEALILQGAISGYGVQLDVAPSSPTFTLSYDVYYLEYTKHTPTLFLANGWDANVEEWASFGVGWQESLAFAAGAWIHDQVNKTPTEWGDLWTTGGNGDLLLTDGQWTAWKNITFVSTDGVLQVYINGEAVEQANANAYLDFVGENSKLFIGVNPWDTPLNGAIDNLYIYDRALTQDDIKELINGRDYAKAVKPEVKEPETTSNKAQIADKNNVDYLQINTDGAADTNEGGLDSTVIIIAVVVVVVIVIVVVVAVVASKKKGDDDDEE